MPQMPQNAGNMNMENISDDQLNAGIEMMKNNPDLLKSMGYDVSPEQMEMMSKFMTPDNIRMAKKM